MKSGKPVFFLKEERKRINTHAVKNNSNLFPDLMSLYGRNIPLSEKVLVRLNSKILYEFASQDPGTLKC